MPEPRCANGILLASDLVDATRELLPRGFGAVVSGRRGGTVAMKQAARESFQQGDTEAAWSHLRTLLEHYRGMTENGTGESGRYQKSSQEQNFKQKPEREATS